MTNREAIRIINQYDMNFHWNDGEPIPAEQLAEAFDLSTSALEKQEQDRWIPVTERLPEEYGEYRITWKTSRSDKIFIADSAFDPFLKLDNEHGRFKGWFLDDYINFYPDVEVIAWKPIEEPYTPPEK